MSVQPIRFPLQPLADALAVDIDQDHDRRQLGTSELTGLPLLAARLGFSRGMVQAARSRGLSEKQADVWAARAGLHPASVWGALWWENVDSDEGDDGFYSDDPALEDLDRTADVLPFGRRAS